MTYWTEKLSENISDVVQRPFRNQLTESSRISDIIFMYCRAEFPERSAYSGKERPQKWCQHEPVTVIYLQRWHQHIKYQSGALPVT